MTSLPQTQGRAEYSIGPVVRGRAEELQREGLTLREIAERLGYRRDAIVQILYSEKVER